MGSIQQSIQAYNTTERANSYHVQQGFDPARKNRMLDVTVEVLTRLAPVQATLLELGAGTGLLSRKILATHHFHELYVTDGAPAMLQIARRDLDSEHSHIHFEVLDFSQPWTDSYSNTPIHAVTSSMAFHHIEDKQQLFQDIWTVLAPQGTLVFADHMAGASPLIDALIGRERGRIRLAAQGQDAHDEQAMLAFLEADAQRQAAEGNRCESVLSYLDYLTQAGFHNVDCLWRDYWLAVFVAQKS